MKLPSKEPEISVGITSDKQINFELYGDFKSGNSNDEFSGRFSAEIINDKISFKRGSEKYEAQDNVIFVPQDIETESFLVKDVTIGKKFHWERKEKQRFIGTLKLIKDNGKLTVINILPLEKYLVSVISSEMSAKSSLQLLKAHAIVSRSWLLSNIKSRTLKTKSSFGEFHETGSEYIKWYSREEHEHFDVCADDHCQRYQGITKISSEGARKAVEQTNGIVLLYDNSICDARYSKSCGGVTESFENVWEPVKYDYLTSIVDYKFDQDNYNIDFSSEQNVRKWIVSNPPAFCNTKDDTILNQVLPAFDQETKDFYRWKVEYSQEEISSIIKTKSGYDFGNIIDLVPVERGASGRLVILKIVGSDKSLVVGKELEIRKYLSLSHLYSSAFVVDRLDVKENIPGKFLIRGAGWGHGVGMCQIGAAVMSQQGYQFDEILLHYFKDVKLKKLY
ncbi:MAG: SpoIID/LytB domain-containing protein [Ignavibacteriales bacterium]|nr:MAG: SpoIID/LytB domain-containing protein [Ignavibacteriales bacterium]